MADAIAVLNAGSSSIKYSLFLVRGKELEPSLRGQVEGLYTRPRFVAKNAAGELLEETNWAEGVQLGHAGALDHLVPFVRAHLGGDTLAAIGHRVVHGGMDYTRPVRMDSAILQSLEQFVPLAPLHQPHNLAPIRVLLERMPQLPQVACYDTAFHHVQPPLARSFALPRSLTAEGVRRYGFHGLSYEFVASRLAELDPALAAGRVIAAHLGNGASLCAMQGGRSIATTMGFTAADGLMMGTRCGTLDPGVLIYLMDRHGMGARELEDLIYRRSGLLGVSALPGYAQAARLHGTGGSRGDPPLYLPHRAGGGVAGGRLAGIGRACLHGRHWRERGPDSAARG